MTIGATENQKNPEATINAMVIDRLAKSVAGGSDVTLTDPDEAQYAEIELTGAITADINVIVPTQSKTYLIYNNTSGDYAITVKTTAGTGIQVHRGDRIILRCDATNVVRWPTSAPVDTLIDGMLTHDMASDADYTLSTSAAPEEWRYEIIKITDTSPNLTTGRNIIVQDNTKKYLFINATLQTLTLKTSGGSGIAVATVKNAILVCDGTNVIRMSADS